MIQRRDWLWLLAINVVANVIVDVTFNDHRGEVLWLAIIRGAWPGFVVSTTISSLCLTVVPRLAHVVLHRPGVWTRWMILIVTLVALAVAGTALAIALLTAVGYIPGWDNFFQELRDTLRIAILVTLGVGIYTTLNEALKARLDRTSLALRTKERDEADARRLASEAQLASLESRVNPHFLFNTLNSIAALTREDATRAERMTTQLASLMRASLDAGSTPLVPLAQEVQNVRDYLEIEQVRFADRLRYDIQIASDAACALVPRLALQTVVENCVKYAVSPRREGAFVRISAERADGQVCLEVADDGPGFDAAAVPDGHGLAILGARLALLYGTGASLSVNSRPGRTTIGIVVPASEGDA